MMNAIDETMLSETECSPPFPSSCQVLEKIDLESVEEIVVSINRFVQEFLADPGSRTELRAKCASMIGGKGEGREEGFVGFSKQSVLSNMYRGIDGLEAAIRAEKPEECVSLLRDVERMLQVPALLNEHGATAGIENSCLVSVSYFYLSAVKKLQKDEWQVAMHFLQELLVSPRIAWEVFAPDLCEFLFPSVVASQGRSWGGYVIDEEQSCEAMREVARKYKGWLMYYQVMLYGETPQWSPGEADFFV